MKEYRMYGDGVHKVCLTIMDDVYVGRIIFEIEGNCHGSDIIESAICFFEDYDSDMKYVESDCNLHVCEWDEKFIGVTLHSENGDYMTAEYERDEISRLIIGVEIIDYKEGET